MVKLIDIAEHLSLSRITVSAVLNDRHKALGISEATAQRVLRAAEELGYRRNQLAMAVKTGRTYTFGIMLRTHHVDDWQGQTLKGAFDAVHSTDYNIKIDFLTGDAEENRSLGEFLGQRVEGLFGLNLHPSPEDRMTFRGALEKHRIPTICSNSAPDISGTEVEPDHEGGCHLAMQHLVELGHTRIAYIGGGDVTEAGIRRKEGFLTGLEKFQLALAPGHLQQCGWEVARAEAATRQLLSDPDSAPSAILCANDIMAVVAIRRARGLGVNVPRDLSVVGFSNETLTELSDPPLTVVDMHHEEVGRRALQILLDHVQGPHRSDPLAPGLHTLPTDLIVRASTAPPR